MGMLIRFIASIILGLLPEVLFVTMYLIYIKNITDKKLKLIVLIAISYIVCIMIQAYKIAYYIGFLVLIYIILKFLYKKKVQIIDIFVISISLIYMTLISYICYIFLKEDLSNYFILMIIGRILLFIPFIFRNKFNVFYKKYCLLWNRNDNIKRPIKSITLRNISLITINIAIFLMNLYAISVINFIK